MYCLKISLCKEKYLRRIETVEFIKMRDQLVELFSTEDKDIFYIPAYRNEEKEAIKVKIILQYMYQEKFFGCKKIIFYFFFNFFIEHELSFKCLTDTDQEKYLSIDIIRDWEESFNERQNVLNSRKKKRASR